MGGDRRLADWCYVTWQSYGDTHSRKRVNSVRLTSFLAYPRFIRPWYLAYLLLGITTAGMIPILLPLMIEAYSHRLMAVALVTCAYELGLLTSPVWGIAAERYNLYRALFFTGFATAAFATALMPVLHILSGWLFLAFAIGAGTGGDSTVSATASRSSPGAAIASSRVRSCC